MKPPSFAPGYVAFYPMLCEIAQKHGYNLSVSGSVNTDFDLVATPWIEDADEAETLVLAFKNYATTCMTFMFENATVVHGPEEKPHGRKAWSIVIGNGAVIDLSIMPLIKTTA